MLRLLEWIHDNARVVVLFVLSVICLIIPGLNRIPGIGGFIAEGGFSQIALVLMSLLMIYIIFEHREIKKKLDSIAGSIEPNLSVLISSLNGVEVRRFSNSAEQMLHVAKKIREAKNYVADVSWVARRPSYRDRPDRKAADDAYHQAIRAASKEIEYREIFVFNHRGRGEALRKRIDENMDLYSCRVFSDEKIPRIQFLLVDDEVNLLGWYGSMEVRCSIRHADVANAFKLYYNQLWDCAEILKDGAHIEWVKVNAILSSFGIAPIMSGKSYAVKNSSL
jgi:hypothetical protein